MRRSPLFLGLLLPTPFGACGGEAPGPGADPASPPSPAAPGPSGAAPAPARAVPAALELALVVGDRVLLGAQADEAWAGGPPALSPRPLVGTTVSRPAAPGRLPDGLGALRGHRVRLYDAAGALCEATLGAPHLVGAFLGLPGGDDEEGDAPPPPRRPASAGPTWHLTNGSTERPEALDATPAEVWAWTEGARWLAADLVYDAACDRVALGRRAAYARSTALPAPPVAPAADAAPQLAELVRREQRQSQPYLDIQRDYERWRREASTEEPGAAPAPALWDGLGDGGMVQLLRLPGAAGERTLVLARAHGNDSMDSCGGFNAELWTLWDLEGEPAAPRLRLRASGRALPAIEGALDLGGGALRLLYRGDHGPGAVAPLAADEDPLELLVRDYDLQFVCPC